MSPNSSSRSRRKNAQHTTALESIHRLSYRFAMDAFLDKSVSASNRVSVLAGFVTDDPPNKQELIADAFRVTEKCLLDLSQTGSGDEVARYLGKQQEFEAPKNWDAFVAAQIGELQRVSLLQKLIEHVGDDLSSWQPSRVSPDSFAAALKGLEYLVMFDPENQIQSWCAASIEACGDRLQALSRVLTGFTIVGSNNRVENDSQAYTAISFAADRIVSAGRSITI